jgi:hypothetical protein
MDTDENEVKRVWGPNCYFSHGTNKSSGVVTIIPKKIKFVEENVIKDNDGRFLIVTGLVSGKKLTI